MVSPAVIQTRLNLNVWGSKSESAAHLKIDGSGLVLVDRLEEGHGLGRLDL